MNGQCRNPLPVQGADLTKVSMNMDKKQSQSPACTGYRSDGVELAMALAA
ncbi:hypothetical protein ACQZV8_06930 [Magnetococcales bacterium HHB-1]